MNKSAIQRFAIWARTELIDRVTQRAYQYDITKDGYGNANAETVSGRPLTPDEQRQRRELVEQIRQKGYTQVMEEVAYTWFNRFIALRFMEVNNYLPSHTRVFSDSTGVFKPEILEEAMHLDLPGLEKDKVLTLLERNQTEDLYRYLLLTQCNALNEALPGMFERMGGYTEMLLPNNILRQDSVLGRMVTDIPEEDWCDAVQIIGWLYQYYNSEKKDDVFAALKKNVKITKENIPAATQLFTPDWIVRYMVENSLGRLWVEGHLNDELKSQWKYYLEEAEQEPEVQTQLAEIRKEYAALTPDQLKVIDPCSGSGHILAYMFDVLMQIYESYGYTTREAVASIVEHNLYGLDIDDRAAQLAYFAVMMKARQYDRRFFSRGIQPHVYAIEESNHVDSFALEYFCNGDAKLKKAMDTIISELHDAKEYGSILTVTPQDWSALYARFAEIKEDIHISREAALRELLPLVQTAETLAQKYDTVVTNPPYMGSNGMSNRLADYVAKYYSDSKSDLFAVFIEKCKSFTSKNGLYGMITQPSLLFLASFEKLRKKLVEQQNFSSLLHMGRGIFGIDFGSTAFVIRNANIQSFNAHYFRLHDRTFQYIDPNDICDLYLKSVQNLDFEFDFGTYNTKTYDNVDDVSDNDESYTSTGKTHLHYITTQDNFVLFPGTPLAYWASKSVFSAFSSGKVIRDIANPCEGIKTGDNERFLKLWFEINAKTSTIFTDPQSAKWFKHAKGGPYRRWYGNLEYMINWENDGQELKNFKKSTVSNEAMFFTDAITWSYISAGKISMRCVGNDVLYNNKGPACYCSSDKLYYLLALSNSVVFNYILSFWAATMDFKPGNIAVFPYIDCPDKSRINALAVENVRISRNDWDSFETSWDFQHHPLLRNVPTIAEAFTRWQAECNERFNQLKANEEELNRIFIDIYGLQEDLTPEVEDKDVTVRKADLGRDIRSFISYAVGCMFGRYSLDVDGLAYAGGEWDNSKYASFAADKDNIIPICDDEYFEDDIVGLFVKFVKTVYGADTLDENLKFIADALGGKGQPKDVIRNYFLSDFYSDHCKIYQKRPIYWLFDSGKKNGFKALIYMHRYRPDLLARMRTDYVHELQERYCTQLQTLEAAAQSAVATERVKLNKRIAKLKEQALELQTYEEKIHHLADQMIAIDLDDGVKHNYGLFGDVLAKIK